MIQRIQTIYLVIVLILAIISFYIPFYNLEGKPEHQEILTGKYLFPILGLICAATTAAIFAYTKRKVQKIICFIVIVLEIAYAITLFVIFNRYFIPHEEMIRTNSFVLAGAFTFISIILTLLAIRSINKDENLIRSMDRLR